MVKEIKISLPLYKTAYAIFFVVILSFIRGVSFTYEIGIALEAPLAILAAVFCADTYAQEIVSKRSEIQRLYPIKKRLCSIIRRLVIQEIFLVLLAIIGYGLFYVFQKPLTLTEAQRSIGNEAEQFWLYVAAVLITIVFWGTLSNTLTIFFHNVWGGIGSCLIIWLISSSTIGERYLGSWGLFSYTFRSIKDIRNLSWMWGKGICLCIIIIMMAILPLILKKRG